jgi:hypothetical protein
MPEARTGVRYAVHQLSWVQPEYDDDPYLRRLPKSAKVAAFSSLKAAEADRRERETAARAAANPFRHGGASLFYQTSFDAPRLHDWLLDAGITPPRLPADHSDWIAWWDAFARTWNALQLAHAWKALDKVRFFEVVEERSKSRAYAVVEINWTWNDNPFLDADAEGGTLIRAFRSRAKAETECERLNAERRALPQFQEYRTFDYQHREGKIWDAEGDWTQSDISEAVFFEVVEIETEE